MTAIWAVVPAAGSGSRMGAKGPKQYLELHGRPLLYWSLDALLAHSPLSGCMVALPAADVDTARESMPEDSRVLCCAGGAERADSVAAGIEALPATDEDWVLVHDAARPCLAATDLKRLIDRVTETGIGGLLAVPVTDTLKKSDSHSRVVDTIDRSALWRAQTPQMFRVGELREALAAAKEAGHPVTDEASAMEYAGHPVQLVEASASNIKVTFAEDLELAAFWLSRHRSPITAAVAAEAGAP